MLPKWTAASFSSYLFPIGSFDSYLTYDVDLIDSSFNELYFNEDKFLLPKNDYLIVGINLYNFYPGDNIDMPDGAMDIIFPDVKFTFSTTQ